jgi:hypothetical protein
MSTLSGPRAHPSITLVAAGTLGFLILIQSFERPERYARSRRLATVRSSAHGAGVLEQGRAVVCVTCSKPISWSIT